MGRVLTDAPRPGRAAARRRGGAAVFPDVLRDALSSLPSSPLPKFPPHAFFGFETGKTFLRQIDETQTRTFPRPRDAKGRTASPQPSDAKNASPPSPSKKRKRGETPKSAKAKKRRRKTTTQKAQKATAKNPQTNAARHKADGKTHAQCETISAERNNGGNPRNPIHGANKRQ